MRANKEYQLCRAISTYMKLQYPNVLFHFDYAGLHMTKVQSAQMKAIQGKRGWTDFFIAKPSRYYHGLFLELKIVTPFLKDGFTLKSDSHLREQSEMHEKLRDEGYFARFAVGFKETEQMIKWYLNTNK